MGKLGEQGVDAARVVGVARSRVMDEGREQVGRHAEPRMEVQLVVGPMVLRAQREAARILEGAKHAFDDRLPAIRANNLGRTPRMLIGHQHQAPEPLLFEAIQRGGIDRVGEDQRAACAARESSPNRPPLRHFTTRRPPDRTPRIQPTTQAHLCRASLSRLHFSTQRRAISNDQTAVQSLTVAVRALLVDGRVTTSPSIIRCSPGDLPHVVVRLRGLNGQRVTKRRMMLVASDHAGPC